ncbi:MAG: hypothetical protein FJW35_13215 [Acidobacteria bacterium]|nr:hypothetical protein [Acidobacteriota bacterium]
MWVAYGLLYLLHGAMITASTQAGHIDISAPDRIWQAAGHMVFTINMFMVSMLHLAEGIQYRLVGDRLPDTEGARAAAPSLEDGYVWLMKSAGQSVDATQPTWPVRAVGGAAILDLTFDNPLSPRGATVRAGRRAHRSCPPSGLPGRARSLH